MSLLRFEILEGRSDAEPKALLDAAHEAMPAALRKLPRDRYRIVGEVDAQATDKGELGMLMAGAAA